MVKVRGGRKKGWFAVETEYGVYILTAEER